MDNDVAISRKLLPGAVIEQRTRWTVARVEGEWAYLANHPRTPDCVEIPIEIADLVAKGIVDDPRGAARGKEEEPAPVPAPPSGQTAIALDVETGGTSEHYHALISIGACVFDLATGETFDEIEVEMAPEKGLTIHPSSTRIHGITEWEARRFPPERESLGKFHVWLKERKGLIAWEHSSSRFDQRFLAAAYERQAPGREIPVAGWDCLWNYNKLRRDKQKMGLDDLCRRFGIEARGRRHGALDDARRLARVVPLFLAECRAQGCLV